MAVDIVECGCYLVDDVADLFVRERIVVQFSHLHHAVQVHVKKLKHHIESVFVADYFQTLHDVCML